MKTFRGFRAEHRISGNESDAYYNLLPQHDLGALSNYFVRYAKHQKCKNIFDIGANIGLSTLLMSEICPAAHIFAFEPAPATYNTLVQNISNNLASAFVTPVQSAVGDRNGSIRFAENASNSSASHITDSSDGTVVDVTTLDEFVESRNIASVDFIKIDVEGHEKSVIDGAVKTIFRFRPVVLLEYNEYALRLIAGRDPVELLSSVMSSLGQLAVVNPLSGEATALPPHPQEAYDKIKSISKSEFDVFDLATQYF